MTLKVALISDTHGDLPEDVLDHLKDVDEIWHAGDIGSLEIVDQLNEMAKTRIVYGNIDGHKIRTITEERLVFELYGKKYFMLHIGAYPPRYNTRIIQDLDAIRPDYFICGHSHILKVIRDKQRNLIHLNPGACGYKGFHIHRTFLLFDVSEKGISNLRVADLGRRGRIG